MHSIHDVRTKLDDTTSLKIVFLKSLFLFIHSPATEISEISICLLNLFKIRKVYYLNHSLPNSLQCTDFKFLACSRLCYMVRSWMHLRALKFNTPVPGSSSNLSLGIIEVFNVCLFEQTKMEAILLSWIS